MGAVVTIMATAGTLAMSAIKRDRGVTDTGTLVQGHAGVLDQIDNVCFAAPVFYHLTRFSTVFAVCSLFAIGLRGNNNTTHAVAVAAY